MKRISLGTYSLETAQEIQRKYSERRDNVKKKGRNLKSHILLRPRGQRDLYLKINGEFKPLQNQNGDIPAKYAQRFAVYLILDTD